MHCQCHVPRYLCVIFDINYHHYMRISISLDTAYPKLRPDKQARGMCIVLAYSYGTFNCDRLHIVITFTYIITPLPTSTHKPVLARAPSSVSKDQWVQFLNTSSSLFLFLYYSSRTAHLGLSILLPHGTSQNRRKFTGFPIMNSGSP